MEQSNVSLTKREQEVLIKVAQGLQTKEVARRLGISPASVEAHLDHIYRKLGVTNRTEAAYWAWRNGLMDATDGLENQENP